MSDFYSSKIISNHFHVDKNKGYLGIGYNIIIAHDLMVQIVSMTDFKRQVLQCDDAAVPMKNPTKLLGQKDLTSREMCEVLVHTEEPDSTKEATGIMVKVINSTYYKV